MIGTFDVKRRVFVQNGDCYGSGLVTWTHRRERRRPTIVVFWLKFHWICSQVSNWQQASIGLENGLAPNRRQAILCTTNGLVWRFIYAALGLNELIVNLLSTIPWQLDCAVSWNIAVPVTDNDPFILHIQWQGCWFHRYARRQSISSHDII